MKTMKSVSIAILSIASLVLTACTKDTNDYKDIEDGYPAIDLLSFTTLNGWSDEIPLSSSVKFGLTGIIKDTTKIASAEFYLYTVKNSVRTFVDTININNPSLGVVTVNDPKTPTLVTFYAPFALQFPKAAIKKSYGLMTKFTSTRGYVTTLSVDDYVLFK